MDKAIGMTTVSYGTPVTTAKWQGKGIFCLRHAAMRPTVLCTAGHGLGGDS